MENNTIITPDYAVAVRSLDSGVGFLVHICSPHLSSCWFWVSPFTAVCLSGLHHNMAIRVKPMSLGFVAK